MTASQRIADGVVRVAGAAVGDADLEAARRCLLDTLGCLVAGSRTAEVERLATVLDADAMGVVSAGPGPDQVLVSATAVRALDFNDSFSRRNNMHPSELVVPIVLAEATRQGWGGDRVLHEIVAGYRICLGVAELWDGLLGRGWAPTASLGQIVAAATRASALGLSGPDVAMAISMAAVTSGTAAVVFRGRQSDLKSMVNGLAAAAGWRACDFVRAGLTAPIDAVDGTSGFNEMVGGTADLDAVDRWPELGPGDMWLKAYPAVFHSHSAIEAAIDVAGRSGGRHPRHVVATVSAKVAAVTAQPFRWTVETGAQGQFSLPYCVGIALADGAFGLAQVSDERALRADVSATLSRVEVRTTGEFDTYSHARVDVEFEDGTTATAEVPAPYGHATRPLSRTDLERKVLDLTRWADRTAVAEPLIELVLDRDPTPAALRLALSR